MEYQEIVYVFVRRSETDPCTVSPTAAGMALLEEIAPAFSTIAAAVKDVSCYDDSALADEILDICRSRILSQEDHEN